MIEKIPVSEHFTLDEFMDKESYNNLVRGIKIAEFIRATTGLPVTINNWANGGQYNFSGYRPPDCTVGSPTSEHRKMNANDKKIHGLTGQEMFNWAEKHAKELYDLGVRRIEDPSITKTWLHTDCKEHGRKGIKVIDLTKETKFIPVI